MALYHPIERTDLARLTAAFGLTLKDAQGLAKGSINTNYVLDCVEGRYFLRHTHQRSAADLTFEAGLLAHLKEGGFPCPRPLLTQKGEAFVPFTPGFVSVFPYEPGEELDRKQLTHEHARRAGEMLGRMHRLGRSFHGSRTNPYAPEVVAGWLEGLRQEPDAEVQGALPDLARAFELSQKATNLSLGPIHGDYFRDNVKWLGDRISAVFDFEMACVGPLMLDVGIGLCEWSFDESFEAPKMRNFVEGYRAGRAARLDELDGLYEMTVYGAVRFTLSRVRDFHLSKLPEGQLARKDWRRYLRRTRELLELGPRDFRERCGLAR